MQSQHPIVKKVESLVATLDSYETRYQTIAAKKNILKSREAIGKLQQAIKFANYMREKSAKQKSDIVVDKACDFLRQYWNDIQKSEFNYYKTTHKIASNYICLLLAQEIFLHLMASKDKSKLLQDIISPGFLAKEEDVRVLEKAIIEAEKDYQSMINNPLKKFDYTKKAMATKVGMPAAKTQNIHTNQPAANFFNGEQFVANHVIPGINVSEKKVSSHAINIAHSLDDEIKEVKPAIEKQTMINESKRSPRDIPSLTAIFEEDAEVEAPRAPAPSPVLTAVVVENVMPEMPAMAITFVEQEVDMKPAPASKLTEDLTSIKLSEEVGENNQSPNVSEEAQVAVEDKTTTTLVQTESLDKAENNVTRAIETSTAAKEIAANDAQATRAEESKPETTATSQESVLENENIMTQHQLAQKLLIPRIESAHETQQRWKDELKNETFRKHFVQIMVNHKTIKPGDDLIQIALDLAINGDDEPKTGLSEQYYKCRLFCLAEFYEMIRPTQPAGWNPWWQKAKTDAIPVFKSFLISGQHLADFDEYLKLPENAAAAKVLKQGRLQLLTDLTIKWGNTIPRIASPNLSTVNELQNPEASANPDSHANLNPVADVGVAPSIDTAMQADVVAAGGAAPASTAATTANNDATNQSDVDNSMVAPVYAVGRRVLSFFSRSGGQPTTTQNSVAAVAENKEEIKLAL